MGRRIFVFTAGKKEARTHLLKSVDNPVPLKKALRTFGASHRKFLRDLDRQQGLYAWGAIPGGGNTRRWTSMNQGDWILGVCKRRYRYAARLIAKFENAAFARAVWGTEKKTRDTWRLMYFFERPTLLDIRVPELARSLSKSYRGGSNFSPEKLAKLVTKFGSIDSFIEQKVLGHRSRSFSGAQLIPEQANNVARPALTPRRVYTDSELARLFSVRADALPDDGGTIRVPALDSTLVFARKSTASAPSAVGDYWDRRTLIYSSRSQKSHSSLIDESRAPDDGGPLLWVFENAGGSKRRFLGNPISRAPIGGDEGRGAVRRFALELKAARPRSDPKPPRASELRKRKSRAFREDAPPPKPPKARDRSKFPPDQFLQQQEKAQLGHHEILVALSKRLRELAWEGIDEIVGAVDLMAHRKGVRILFEAKTVSLKTEIHQVRSAIAQLLHYRHDYGRKSDHLCVVTNGAISSRFVKFLEALGIGSVFVHGERVTPLGTGRVTQEIGL